MPGTREAAKTAHVDTFALDGLPAAAALPEFIFELPELDYPERLNVARELLEAAVAEGHGSKPAIYSSGRTWTYADLNTTANRIANVLTRNMGLVPGNRVLLRAPNNPMLAACWFAVLKAGGIVVATMPLLRAKELAGVIAKGRISHALCDSRLCEELYLAQAEAGLEIKLKTFGTGGSLGAAMEAQPTEFECVDTARDDPALLSFTSGTTGRPKAIVHFHSDILAMTDTFSRHILKPGPDDIFAGTPPLGFTFGLGISLAFPLRVRAATVLDEIASPGALLEAIGKFKTTILGTAPTGYRAMLGELDKGDISSLRACVSAGETLPRSTFDAWREATGLKLIDGIGSTEMIHIFISAAGDDIRPGATGKPVPGFRAEVMDGDMNPLPPGEVGLLAVKGPTGCRYLDDERQGDYVVGGWNLTGDAYKKDEDGYFWYQARADDMIISGGYNISGIEVEDALMQHQAVAECAVVGVPDMKRGQIVKAFIVPAIPEEAGEPLAQELKDFAKRTIAPYKYPRAIEFVEALPKTQTGKIQRFKLRRDAAAK